MHSASWICDSVEDSGLGVSQRSCTQHHCSNDYPSKTDQYQRVDAS